jgi:hypothetical protein
MLKMILDPMGGILFVHLFQIQTSNLKLPPGLPTMEMQFFVKLMLRILQQRI